MPQRHQRIGMRISSRRNFTRPEALALRIFDSFTSVTFVTLMPAASSGATLARLVSRLLTPSLPFRLMRRSAY